MKRLIIPPNSKVNNITISSSVENSIETSDNSTIKNIFIKPIFQKYYRSLVILKGNFNSCNILITEQSKIVFDNFSILTNIEVNTYNKELIFVGNPLTPTNVFIKSPCKISHYTDITPTNLNFIIDYNDITKPTTITGNNYLGYISIHSPCSLYLKGIISIVNNFSLCNITLFEQTTISNLLPIAPINLYGYKDSLNTIPNNPLIRKEETIFLVDFYNNLGILNKSLLNYASGEYKLSLYINLGNEKIEIPNNLSFFIEN